MRHTLRGGFRCMLQVKTRLSEGHWGVTETSYCLTDTTPQHTDLSAIGSRLWWLTKIQAGCYVAMQYKCLTAFA